MSLTQTKPVELPIAVQWNNVVFQILAPVDRGGIVIPAEAWESDTIQHALIVAKGDQASEKYEVGQHVLIKQPGMVRFVFLGHKLVLGFDSGIMAIVQE